jgi:hypothetical protein
MFFFTILHQEISNKPHWSLQQDSKLNVAKQNQSQNECFFERGKHFIYIQTNEWGIDEQASDMDIHGKSALCGK